MPGIRIISPGVLSLIQDGGRRGFQRFGVSVSGAMDPYSLLLGNRLVGNQPEFAAVEVTFGGAEFAFDEDAFIAITGADLSASIDGTPVPLWESFLAQANSRLSFGAPVNGMRAYLCVAGGIASAPVLGSRSTHVASGLGGIDGGPLKAGDELPVGPAPDERDHLRAPMDLVPVIESPVTVRVVPGPQEDAFTAAGVGTFYGSEYAISDRSDRQGVRLEGPEIAAVNDRYDIVSDAVVFGSIQVPGDRKADNPSGRPPGHWRIPEDRHGRDRRYPKACAGPAGRGHQVRENRRGRGAKSGPGTATHVDPVSAGRRVSGAIIFTQCAGPGTRRTIGKTSGWETTSDFADGR